MTKQEELDLFVRKSEELIAGKYILADIKIINLLKSMANSETIVAILKNCVENYDFNAEKDKYLVKLPYSGVQANRFILPSSSKELIALIFNVLMKIENGQIKLSDFLNDYFYMNGSFYESYNEFKEKMIKPFCRAVKLLMECVIDGRISDPLSENVADLEIITEKQEDSQEETAEERLAQKPEYVSDCVRLLYSDKHKTSTLDMDKTEKWELLTVIDGFINALSAGNPETVRYAYIAYKYVCAHFKKLKFNNGQITEILRRSRLI